MVIKKEEFIKKYVRALREGNAAVFAGAGLSRPSGFVDWKELVRKFAEEVELDVEKETDLISVTQFYRNKKRNRGSINQEILNAFSKDVKLNENVEILSKLPIFTYWTTNYDQLIEKALEASDRRPDVKYESDQLSNMLYDRDAIVYKMHGDVNHPAHAVLTKEDYELYEYKRPLFRTALKGDLVSKVFLFIGFSFSDPNLDYVLSQIRSLLGENVPNHYCIFKAVQEDSYENPKDFLYASIKQELQVENLLNYGIETIFVDDFEEITEILREIEKKTKFKNVFISGSAAEFNEPWTKEKAEQFAANLAGTLVKEDCRIVSGFGLGIGSAVINGALDVIYKEKYRHLDEHLGLYPFPQNIPNDDERIKQWKRYRQRIIDDTGVTVFMFGNKLDEISKRIVNANGCLEEFKIAKEKGNIIIPIGSTGSATRLIYDEIRNDIKNYPYLKDYIEDLGEEVDNNKIIEIIIKILNDIES